MVIRDDRELAPLKTTHNTNGRRKWPFVNRKLLWRPPARTDETTAYRTAYCSDVLRLVQKCPPVSKVVSKSVSFSR